MNDRVVNLTFACLGGVASIFLRCFVAAKLWFWFIVPFGAPAIGMAHAFGLLLLKHGLARSRAPKSKESSDREKLEEVLAMLSFDGLLLLLGFAAKCLLAPFPEP